MKLLVKGAIAVVLVLVLGVVFVLVRFARGPIVLKAKSGAFPKVVVSASPDPMGFALQAKLSQEAEGLDITTISAPRACATALGLRPPEGFREEAMPLTPEEAKNPDMAAFARKYDAENVRWAGKAPVVFGSQTLLVVPAANPSAGSCELSIRYERRGRLGGMSSGASVTIGQGAGGPG